MEYVFGPVPSRRLGRSLGIDPIPLKTCNWNCVYCQLGRTLPLINDRTEYVPEDSILREVEQSLEIHSGGIDWVTFVGSGEPTLHSRLGHMIRAVKRMTSLPVAVITNGALLDHPEVRRELAPAEAVLPSLDAGDAALFRRVNRPHPAIKFDRMIHGLIAFRRQYHYRLWIEVMLIRGVNDTEEALRKIAAVVERIGPDELHLNLPTRPPAEVWVQAPGPDGLQRALSVLGTVAKIVHPPEGEFDLSGCDDLTDALVAIITRHPVSQQELEHTLARWAPGRVRQAIADLQACGRAQVVKRNNIQFWTAQPARFPDEASSWRTVPDGMAPGKRDSG